jgi:hypothetical protein
MVLSTLVDKFKDIGTWTPEQQSHALHIALDDPAGALGLSMMSVEDTDERKSDASDDESS